MDFYFTPNALKKLGETATQAWIEVKQLQLDTIPPLEEGYSNIDDIRKPDRTSYFANDNPQ